MTLKEIEMTEYDPKNRHVGQISPKDGYILRDFLGPVELYEVPNSENYVVYMYVEPNERLYFNVHRRREEAEELFRCACRLVSHLCGEGQLISYLHPFQS
jgi:hypothetical protein